MGFLYPLNPFVGLAGSQYFSLINFASLCVSPPSISIKIFFLSESYKFSDKAVGGFGNTFQQLSPVMIINISLLGHHL